MTEQWARWKRAGWTFREIAVKAGVDESTVRRAVGHTGERPGTRLRPPSVEAVHTLWLKNWTVREIAEEFSVSKGVIYHRLFLAGEDFKDPNGPRNARHGWMGAARNLPKEKRPK